MERAKGFEPSAQNSRTSEPQDNPQTPFSDHTHIRAQILEPFGPELAKVVGAWQALTQPLKAAILAIVESSARQQKEEP